MKNLAKAVLAVMDEVKGVEKNMTVGAGQNTYKGVSDKDVKTAIGRSMQKHGLALLPIGIEDTVQIDRWEETNNYGTKQKQNVNVSVKTRYLLLHDSGESQEVVGYGHGIDPQDKAAGKATTYALKNLLLYMFLVPTGTIDDTDNTHSDNIPTPPPPKAQPAKDDNDNPWLNENTPEWTTAVDFLRNGFTDKQGVQRNGSIALLRKKFKVSTKNESKLVEQAATETP